MDGRKLLAWTITGPYEQCGICKHPGPPKPVASVTLLQTPGVQPFVLIPHFPDCRAPYHGSPTGMLMVTLHEPDGGVSCDGDGRNPR